jgi:hypothetical protein
MELEWRTTDKNTFVGECDVCHYERSVKRMLIPEVKYFVMDDEDDEDEYFYEDEDFQSFCLSCYKQAETEAGF